MMRDANLSVVSEYLLKRPKYAKNLARHSQNQTIRIQKCVL